MEGPSATIEPMTEQEPNPPDAQAAPDGDPTPRPEDAPDAEPTPPPEAEDHRPVEMEAPRIVEAILFASDAPLPPAKIATILGVGTAKEVRSHVDALNAQYAEWALSFRIEEIAGGYQMMTLPAYNTWLAKLLRTHQETRLSPAALETLAIVAYKQPCTRADIEAIRGVAAGDLLNRLREMNLIRIVGRAEDLGRPLLYGTTKRFLQFFGLPSLDDLPQVEALAGPAAGQLASTPDGTGATIEAEPGDTNQPPNEQVSASEPAETTDQDQVEDRSGSVDEDEVARHDKGVNEDEFADDDEGADDDGDNGVNEDGGADDDDGVNEDGGADDDDDGDGRNDAIAHQADDAPHLTIAQTTPDATDHPDEPLDDDAPADQTTSPSPDDPDD